MRFHFFTLVLGLSLFAVSADAQKINYVGKNVPVLSLFKEIKRQTGFKVVWNEKKLDVNKRIDANFSSTDLDVVMKTILSAYPLTFIIVSKTIVIKEDEIQRPVVKDSQPVPGGIAVEGLIVDEANLPLVGANIQVKDNKDKTVTDAKGRFSLKNVKEGAILLVSFVGFSPREVRSAIQMGKIQLSSVVGQLDEIGIINTGYQFVPKERATGSFATVDSTQLNRRVSSDFFTRLEGITSGLLFNKNTLSASSGDLDLAIRGRSTIYANDQPLVILDNFPYIGNFESINPNDIANVSILKDAAAASIWGVRAGNGVIVITTKRAMYKQPLNVVLNTNVSIAGKPDLFYDARFMRSSDFIDLEKFLFANGRYDAALRNPVNFPSVSPVVELLNKQRSGTISSEETQRQLDILGANDMRNEELKYFYRNAVSQQYALSLSGGTSKSNHYFSAGYDQKRANLIKNNDDRLTINSQNTIRPFKNLEIDAGLYYVNAGARVDSTIAETQNNYYPYYKFRDENGLPAVFNGNGSAAFNAANADKGFLDWSYVPLDELGRSPKIVNDHDLRLNGGINYSFLSGFNFSIKYQYQEITKNADMYRSIDAHQTRTTINRYSILTDDRVTGYNIPLGGILYNLDAKALSQSFRAQLNYQKIWQKHGLSAIIGYELSEFDSEAKSKFSYGLDNRNATPAEVDAISTFRLYPSGTGKIPTGGDLFGKLDRIRSVFSNFSYTYAEKYTISGSARIDGSNYFGIKTNQKRVPLWSAGALWNLSREDFYASEWLPVLKIRASYGYNGNLNKNITGITTLINSVTTSTLTGLPFSVISNLGNPELRWEKIGIANFGVEFVSKNNVLYGKIEYFIKNGTDILGDKAFPSSTGIKTLRGNFAQIKANGVDIILSSQNLNGVLKWKTNLLLSTANDKVSLYDDLNLTNVRLVGLAAKEAIVNRPVYGVYSYKWAGLNPLNGNPRGYVNGEISEDYAAIINNANTEDLIYHGPARPTIFGGFNNTFSFERFTLGINLSYKFGYHFKKESVKYYLMYQNGISNDMHRDFTARWKSPGDEANTDVPSMAAYNEGSARDSFHLGSSANVAKGDHIRLQDISLSYDFDRTNWKKIPLKNMQLYCYVNNLGLLWEANDFGLDPDEIGITGSRLTAPAPMSFAFGIKVNL